MIELSGFLPFIRLSDDILIPTYYLVISTVACLILLWIVRRVERFDLSRNTALDISLAVMIAGFLGSRLFHIVFEAPSVYIQDPMQILRVWEGGFVWYGGALAGAAAGITLVRLRKWPLAPWFDFFAPVAAASYAGGRISCLLTGCCFGAVCYLESGHSFRYPTQLFAILWEAGVVALLLTLEKKRGRQAFTGRLQFIQTPGALFVVWLSLHAIGRIIMEIFRADDRGPAFGPLSISMAISLVILVAMVFVVRKSKAQ